MFLRNFNRKTRIGGLLVLMVLVHSAMPLAGQSTQNPATEVLSRGFDNLELGMDFETAVEALRESIYFVYRGGPDVSLRPGSPDPILSVAGSGLVSEAYFQFRDGVLYSIIILPNTERTDYYGFYTEFSSRYGEPDDLSPQRSLWEDDSTRLVLEKPLTIQYVDLAVLAAILEERNIQDSAQEYTTDRFLDSF